MKTVLKATGISVHFGGVRAVDGVDLEVRAGQLVGLIGPNGAGKTTFVDAITGFVSSRGKVRSTTATSPRCSPHARARPGPRAHLAEHRALRRLDAASRPDGLRPTGRRRWPKLKELVTEQDPRRHREPGAARTGRAPRARRGHARRPFPGPAEARRRRARAGCKAPPLLCLDEPAAGLDTTESEELGRRLRIIVDARHADAPHRPRHGARPRHLRTTSSSWSSARSSRTVHPTWSAATAR